ncbi:HIT domain-containing protein [Sphingomonas corticis]|uniref:HIT domain-containing protein n=1 Tax=Sphingomonas corticis TaxID=2722791 RepID=A0ABX1CGX4_9SPHN|nr:HIT domain-containing protein [Sphingomonas corticis]
MSVDATAPYDDANIFARLLRGEIPSRRVFEDDHTIVFHDIAPWAPHHLLAIPRGSYVSWDDFSARASEAEIVSLTRAIGVAAREAGLVETGYRLIANTGLDSHQEVPHLHVHIMGGRALGPMLVRNDGKA